MVITLDSVIQKEDDQNKEKGLTWILFISSWGCSILKPTCKQEPYLQELKCKQLLFSSVTCKDKVNDS
jgi:hypothetical protein